MWLCYDYDFGEFTSIEDDWVFGVNDEETVDIYVGY
jgi:hypothetical protein